MTYKVLDGHEYNSFVEKLATEETVIAPVPKENRFALSVIKRPEQIADRDRYIPTLLPHKKYLFPRKENLMQFKLGGELEVAPQIEAPPLVFLEVRPCDINGVRLLDKFFVEDVEDENYARRRQAVSIIGLECNEPCDEHCFCSSVGSSVADKGYDLLFSEQGEYYMVRIGTPKGADLLARYASPREATEETIAFFNAAQTLKLSKFPKRLKPDLPSIPLLLSGSYDSPLWAELGKIDLACGACNVVCVTCSCFDMQDRMNMDLTTGERQRKWDGCMLPEFALVASRENFRSMRDQRIRHRIYRKFKYQMQKYGEPFCVGCGRCSRACLVGIHPNEVLDRLFDEIGIVS